MRILLVYPSRLSNGKVEKYHYAFLPPLNLAILSALSKKHVVKVVNDFVEEVKYAKEYDLVCITAMTPQAGRAFQIADKFRSMGVKVVMGGMHATILPEETKEHVDAIVIGEAEDIWEDVLNDCETGKLKDRYQASTLFDLKNSVIPDFSKMNMKIYPKRFGAKLPMMPISTTRGCPNGCSFCSVTKVYGKKYRTVPTSHIIDIIDAVKPEDVFFVDDNIGLSASHFSDLLDGLFRRNINWFSQISTKILDHPELIEKASDTGCFGLFIGVESLNTKNLNSVNKSFNDIKQYEELVRLMHKAKIFPFLSFIFGFDEDTPEQFRITLDFIKRNKISYASFWLLTPLPGTDYYKEMEAADRIMIKDWSQYDLTHITFEPKHFTMTEIEELYWKNFQEVYKASNVVRHLFYQMTRTKKPVTDFFLNLFYQLYCHNKVFSNDHPFSGGILKLKEGQKRFSIPFAERIFSRKALNTVK